MDVEPAVRRVERERSRPLERGWIRIHAELRERQLQLPEVGRAGCWEEVEVERGPEMTVPDRAYQQPQA